MGGACCVCQKSNVGLSCGLCQGSICKSCAQFIDEDVFPFLAEAPEQFQGLTACGPCFDQVVAPVLDQHRQMFERAKDVEVFMKEQGKETRLIKRKNRPVRVQDCSDQNEALLRLAFRAVSQDCDMLVDVELIAKKVHQEAYQTTVWSGQAVPVKTSRSTH